MADLPPAACSNDQQCGGCHVDAVLAVVRNETGDDDSWGEEKEEGCTPNGACVDGYCACAPLFTGGDCSEKATCKYWDFEDQVCSHGLQPQSLWRTPAAAGS